MQPSTMYCDADAHLQTLNRTCQCVSMPVALTNPVAPRHLFADTAVFASMADLRAMQRQIEAIEAASQLPQLRNYLGSRLPRVPSVAAQECTRGILMGYDFHLTADGPRLIEVNTNAGGAFVMHALLADIRQTVCPCDESLLDNAHVVEEKLINMFVDEWRSAGRPGMPDTIAIVDSNPTEQFLYPDMLLAQSMLRRHGIRTIICAPESLQIRNNCLYAKDRKIDFVYNRSTDFALHEPAQRAIRQALIHDLAVVSPAPQHHALFADKRNPAIWRDAARMRTFGATNPITDVLSELPATEPVAAHEADTLWKRRKQLFFKPSAGYGSKATYRGDKLTRRVWTQILEGGYVAQSFEPPPLRLVGDGDDGALMKFDVRIYTYGGQPLLSAARIYQGQTTNFRTQGGGFAPVVYLA